MLNSRTEDIKKLVTRQADYDCFELPEGEEYRIEFIKELIEVKNNIYTKVMVLIRKNLMTSYASCVHPE